jgi:hypothetical protein
MKTLRTLSVLFFALLVLVSSTSFLVGVHFCQGEVENISLFVKAEGCEREQKLPPCHRHMQAPCCDDETVVHSGDHFNTCSNHIHVIAPVAVDIAEQAVLIAEVIPSGALQPRRYFLYDPPLRSADLTVEHHTFLI